MRTAHAVHDDARKRSRSEPRKGSIHANSSTALASYQAAMYTASTDANGSDFVASGTNMVTFADSNSVKFGSLAGQRGRLGQNLTAFLGQLIGGSAVTCFDSGLAGIRA